MKKIPLPLVRSTVAQLCQDANFRLRADIRSALRDGARREKNRLGKELYAIVNETVSLAAERSIPVCQDTGYPVIFVDIGADIVVDSGLKRAILDGVAKGYRAGNLRASVVDPFKRSNPAVTSAVIHFDFVPRKGLTLTVLPKGFGSENKTALKMFKPTASIDDIAAFVVSSVKNAGASACPPFFIGIGIGGTADYALLLSKKALVGDFRLVSKDPDIRNLTDTVSEALKKVPFGIAGLKGSGICLGVTARKAPTHIAGLPVGVSISCWVMRSASKTL